MHVDIACQQIFDSARAKTPMEGFGVYNITSLRICTGHRNGTCLPIFGFSFFRLHCVRWPLVVVDLIAMPESSSRRNVNSLPAGSYVAPLARPQPRQVRAIPLRCVPRVSQTRGIPRSESPWLLLIEMRRAQARLRSCLLPPSPPRSLPFDGRYLDRENVANCTTAFQMLINWSIDIR